MDQKKIEEIESIRKSIDRIREDVEMAIKDWNNQERSDERDDTISLLKRADAFLDESDSSLYYIVNSK